MEITSSTHNSSRQMQTNITCYRQYQYLQCTPTLLALEGLFVVDGNLTVLFPCSHKEAETCLRLHVADAVQKGFRKVYVCTVNTDVTYGIGDSNSLWYWTRIAAVMDPRVCATCITSSMLSQVVIKIIYRKRQAL